MTTPTRILLMGLALGIAIATLSTVVAGRIETQVIDLEAQCEAESDVSELARFLGIGPTCDPIALAATDPAGEAPGVRSELARAQRALSFWGGPWPIVAAVLVVVTSFVPWGWHFLLRRVRELREAALGR